MVVMGTLADRLREARSDRGATQGDLAKQAGVSKQAVSKIEAGSTLHPAMSTMEPIARFLGVNVRWLVDGRAPKLADDRSITAERDDHADAELAGACAIVPHAATYDFEAGPAQIAYPKALLPRELLDMHAAGNLAWILNPTDSMGSQIPKGIIAFVDRSYKTVRENGIYSVRLFGRPCIMRVQVRGNDALRVMGSNRFDDSVDLHGEQVKSLHVGGLVVGYADRVKLIE